MRHHWGAFKHFDFEAVTCWNSIFLAIKAEKQPKYVDLHEESCTCQLFSQKARLYKLAANTYMILMLTEFSTFLLIWRWLILISEKNIFKVIESAAWVKFSVCSVNVSVWSQLTLFSFWWQILNKFISLVSSFLW